jgi:hypothetical protein
VNTLSPLQTVMHSLQMYALSGRNLPEVVDRSQYKMMLTPVFQLHRRWQPLCIWKWRKEEEIMKTKLLLTLMLATGSLFAGTHFSFGINIGSPGYYYAPPPPRVVAYAPPCPGPGYTWVAGYWYPSGPRYSWHAGYWAVPPYANGYSVAPRYYGHRYYPGYWGHRGRYWDRRR